MTAYFSIRLSVLVVIQVSSGNRVILQRRRQRGLQIITFLFVCSSSNALTVKVCVCHKAPSSVEWVNS